MNFAELREEAESLADIWGYSNTLVKPDWYNLVNRAYRDVCWESDVIRGPEFQFPTIAGQREYIVGGPNSVSKFLAHPGNEAADDSLGSTCTQDMKSFLDVCTSDSRHIYPMDENYIRRVDRLWLVDTAGVPNFVWSPRPNVVSLFPTPDGVYNIIMYCVLSPKPFVNDDDIPAIWDICDAAIALRAAYLHSNKYAKGEAREVLAGRDSEYQDHLARIKQLQMEDSGMDTPRYVQWPEPERIFL